MDWHDVFVKYYCKNPSERVGHSLANLDWLYLILNVRWYLQIYSGVTVICLFGDGVFSFLFCFVLFCFLVLFCLFVFCFLFFLFVCKMINLMSKNILCYSKSGCIFGRYVVFSFFIQFLSLFDWINCAERLSTDTSKYYGVRNK